MKHTGEIVEVDTLNQLFTVKPDVLIEHMKEMWSTMPHEFVVEFKNNWFEEGDKLLWEATDDFSNY